MRTLPSAVLVSSKLLPAVCPRPADWARLRITHIRPELSPDSPTFAAAVILLCAEDAGCNIERLARRTGIPRQQISACARRLFDNGVWVDGRAEYAWKDPRETEFWNDVAVAEGRFCRRRDELGRMEWAEAGAWRKAYDYVRAGTSLNGTAVLYLTDEPAPAPQPEPEMVARPAVTAPSRVRAPRPALRQPARVPARVRPDAFAGAARGAVRAAPELFPAAVWLC